MSLLQMFESDSRKVAAWQKATIVPGFDASRIRRDRFGNYISWFDYGLKTTYGWEIDHVWPSSLGGSDANGNLAATHWQANRIKSNRFIG
ncbi:HNH endonuclease domain-containing protein [Anderseniella sp. Alg231-50]|uniref:HNH endonuclease domain-containing protein n=1 Tax=Anderseniella sp. Alg231-50 TaxID=1922226 RepID=UPI00307B8267